MKLFDSHAHLDDEKFDEDRDIIIEEIHKSDVGKFVSAGYSLEGSKKAIELSKKYDFIYATVGVSPNDIPQIKEELWNMLAEIEQMAAENKIDSANSNRISQNEICAENQQITNKKK